jgi:hypothetical protein
MITLPTGETVILDDDDYSVMAGKSWSLSSGYAARAVKGKNGWSTMYLHREIMKPPKGMEVDHINGNRLDNRKANLRICTRTENARNAKSSTGSSRYKGVSFDKAKNKWRSDIWINGGNKFLGYFLKEFDAAEAYNETAEIHFGEFARLNQEAI